MTSFESYKYGFSFKAKIKQQDIKYSEIGIDFKIFFQEFFCKIA